MNTIILKGRMTTNAELRITSDDKPTTIARFSLAVPDKSHRNAEGNFDTDFIKIVAFNKIADNIERFTGKGSELLITGRLHTYSYKNKDNQTVYMAEVIAEKVEFVNDCKKSSDEVIDIPENAETPFK